MLTYDPETGKFSKSYVNPKNGYVYVRFNKKVAIAHRVAWFIVNGEWPEGDIDHINGIRTDNRISNLRVATRSQNLCRAKRPNKTGFRGVMRHANEGRKKRYGASLLVDGKRTFVGWFETAEEAGAAYREASLKSHGEFSFFAGDGGTAQ